ncbi:MAG: MYG1 family protein [bacterium]|nr:MYG1 family protein [bacterium]
MSISSAIGLFNPLWDKDEDDDVGFIEACKLARVVLACTVIAAASNIRSEKIVAELIESATDELLVMEQFIGGWLETILNSDSQKAKRLLYAIFPDRDGHWAIQAIPPSADNRMGQRKPFPNDWRGLSGENLAKAYGGIKTAVFCHAAGFFAVAETREDAIAIASKAVDIPAAQ